LCFLRSRSGTACQLNCVTQTITVPSCNYMSIRVLVLIMNACHWPPLYDKFHFRSSQPLIFIYITMCTPNGI
jgi:hypothetical protein